MRFSPSLLAFATFLACVNAGCEDGSPFITEFTFPSYGNADDILSEGLGMIAPPQTWRACSGSDYYDLVFPVSYQSGVDGSGNPTYQAIATCADGLGLVAGDKEALNTADSTNPDIPPDSPYCCEALRFKTKNDITAEIEEGVFVKININEKYRADSKRFTELCEEYWVCQNYQEQYASTRCEGQRGCRGTELNSLCFMEAYNPSADKELIELRNIFIVEYCFGSSESDFDLDAGAYEDGETSFTATSKAGLGYSIAELEEARDSTCEFAQELADRLSFVPADANLCNDIIQCIVDATNIILVAVNSDQDPVDATNFEDSKFDFCEGDATALAQKKEDVCNGGNSVGRDVTIPQGEGGCLSLPTCPDEFEPYFTNFSPEYPPDGSTYADAVASIRGENLAIENGLDDRTTSDYVGLIGILRATAQGVVIVTEGVKNAFPDDWPYIWKINPWFYASVVYNSFDAVYKQTSLHDGLVNSAEIEAIYENSRQLLDGSAAIYDEVVCRCAEGPRRNHGCDSVDNDCDQTVDSCLEDGIPPQIDIFQALRDCGSGPGCCGSQEVWFSSNEDALACVRHGLEVSDDCGKVQETDVEAILSGTCFDSIVSLNVEDDCENAATQRTVPVYVDLQDPVVSCNFGGIQNAEVIATGQGFMVDPGFEYTATDNCGGPLKVDVAIYANEIEQSQKMAVFYKNNKVNDKGSLYLASSSCSTGANGQCIKEGGYKNRLYTVVVTGTDPSGRKTFAECSVLVTPKNGRTQPISQSIQRFLLAEYTSTFTDYIVPS